MAGKIGQWLVHRRYRDQSVAPEDGAKTIVYLASSPVVEKMTGKYFTDEKEAPSSPLSHDQDLANRLWDVSADLVNLRSLQA